MKEVNKQTEEEKTPSGFEAAQGANEDTIFGERLRFELLVSDLSARFVKVTPEQLNMEIERALKMILEFFQVDRCALLRILPSKGVWVITHLALSEDVPAVPAGVQLPLSIHPWAYEKLVKKREVVIYSRIDDVPPEADIDKKTWTDWGIRSNLVIPILTGETVNHVIAINSVKSERVWPEEFIPRLQLLGEIFVNSIERERIQLQLENMLKFEVMLSVLSARFVSLPSDQVDVEIETGLQQIARFLDLDRCVMARLSDDKSQTVTTHSWVATGVEPITAVVKNEMIPWAVEKIMRSETVIISNVDELPEDAAKDREFFKQIGIKSGIYLPLTAGGEPLGLLGLASLHAERVWPEELVRGLQMAADVFSNTLARQKTDRALRAAELEYRTILNFTYDWEYWENLDGSIRYNSPSCERITGYSPQALIDDPHKMRDLVFTEDLATWDEHFSESRHAPSPLEIQFRIKRPDGEVRWIEHICHRVNNDQGTFIGIRASNRDITRRKQMENKLREQLKEIDTLRHQLEQENIYLRDEINLQHGHDEIVGRSAAMKRVLAQVEQVARTEATVLIQGETGTGKGLLARTIHRLSLRKDRPLITINCAALPPTLIESELFGREKGAYTGAMTRMPGRFEVADRSTLLLDEIGELSPDLQAKLLRVLEEGRFERLGSTKSLQVDVRIIAATNRDLAQDVATGKFRRDLYYRLNVFPISIPPLRERPEDIPPLVWTLVKQNEKKLGKRVEHIPRKSMEDLQRYQWPGNARELRNIVEYAMITSDGGKLHLRSPHQVTEDIPLDGNMQEIERRHIINVLEKTGWRHTGAAEILGMKRTTLNSKMKKLGIKRPSQK
jgi:formate hydrogenlyase transcriptional activator